VSETNTHDIYLYGPPPKHEFFKFNILSELITLSEALLEEKVLGQSINILPPLEKTIIVNLCREKILGFQDKLFLSDEVNNISTLQDDFLDFKNHLISEIHNAFLKTEYLNKQIANPNTKQNRYTLQKISCEKKRSTFKEKLKTYIIKKELEHDLLFVSDCLIQKKLDLLRDHFYFKQKPNYFHTYFLENKTRNYKKIKLYTKIYISKLIAESDILSEHAIIYDALIYYLVEFLYAKDSYQEHDSSNA
jgi:hypothetical protein